MVLDRLDREVQFGGNRRIALPADDETEQLVLPYRDAAADPGKVTGALLPTFLDHCHR